LLFFNKPRRGEMYIADLSPLVHINPVGVKYLSSGGKTE
jgi:hypothetical protein